MVMVVLRLTQRIGMELTPSICIPIDTPLNVDVNVTCERTSGPYVTLRLRVILTTVKLTTTQSVETFLDL